MSVRSSGPFPLPATTPSVSVVIPCYNYGHYLPFAVGSAFDQPGLDVEVVIVDDASTDGSLDVALALAAADSRIRVIGHEVNRGHIQTSNDGLDAAVGEYVSLLSADDVLTPGGLTRSVSLLAAHPNVGLAYGRPVRFSTPRPPPAITTVTAWTTWPGHEWATALFRAGRNALLSPEAVLRMSVQREIGDYDANHPHTSDLSIWLRAAAVADVGHVAGCDQAFYRDHDQNMHSVIFDADKASGLITDLKARLIAFRDSAAVFPDPEAMYGLAVRAIAAEALGLASRAYVWGLTESWPVAELRELALEIYPETRSLPQWRVLQRRTRLGSTFSRRNPMFMVSEKRVRSSLDRELARWHDARF